MKKRTKRVLIVGHGRHGKDTLADLIETHLGLKFRGSSQVAASEVVYPLVNNLFGSAEQAFKYRHHNRELWAALIRDFNRDDPARLAKLVCADGYGYTGLRELKEVKECFNIGLFTHVIWIERPDLEQNDPTMTFGFKDLLRLQGYFKNFCLMQLENVGLNELENCVKEDVSQFIQLG